MATRRRGGGRSRSAELEPRRRAILEAAAEIFHRKGFHATSIQDIAEDVGMLKGSLYYYITSKDDLLMQIINEVHQDAFAEMSDVFEGQAPAVERLRQFIVKHVGYCAAHQAWIGVYLHEYKALPPVKRRRVMRMRDRYEDQVRRLIEHGKLEGSIGSEVDTKLAARGILGMANWLYHWYTPRGPLSPKRIGETFADMALRGVCTPQ